MVEEFEKNIIFDWFKCPIHKPYVVKTLCRNFCRIFFTAKASRFSRDWQRLRWQRKESAGKVTGKKTTKSLDVAQTIADGSQIEYQNWLEDTHINKYMQYLRVVHAPKGNKKTFILLDPLVTQIVYNDPNEASGHLAVVINESPDIVLIPINNQAGEKEGTHWSLLVYYKNKNIFYHLDSFSGANKNAAYLTAWNLGMILNFIRGGGGK